MGELRTAYRDLQLVGLQLAQQIVRRGATVDGQLGNVDARIAHHDIDDVTHLERDRFESGANEVRASGATGEPEDRAARIRIPVRRTEAGQRRDEDHTAGV